MGNILIHNPLVHFYLLYVATLIFTCLCAHLCGRDGARTPAEEVAQRAPGLFPSAASQNPPGSVSRRGRRTDKEVETIRGGRRLQALTESEYSSPGVPAEADRRTAPEPERKGDFMNGYAHPEVLVETDWVKANLGRPGVKVVEIDEDTKAYDASHVPGAVAFNWRTDLQEQTGRDILGKEAFEKLVGGAGIGPRDTVILYGDNNNWFAANGFWLFKLYGHRDVRLMNGGRRKWVNEPDKELATERPDPEPVPYNVTETRPELRALVTDVLQAVQTRACNLVDVRSHDEYTGKVIAPPGMTETAQRGGHVPGAKSIPWGTPVAPDGTFRPADELRTIYLEQKGVDPNRPTITYCRIGERSSHTWFVLTYLLGLKDVRNYDGSWTEYGSLIGAPIEK